MRQFILAGLLLFIAAGCAQAPSYTAFKTLDAPLDAGASACVSPVDRSHVMVNENGQKSGPALETAERIREIIIEELLSANRFAEVSKAVGLACDGDYLIACKLQTLERGGGVPQSHPGMMYVPPKGEPFKVVMILSVKEVASDRTVFSGSFESGTSNVIDYEEDAYREIAKNFAAAIGSTPQ